MRIGAEEAAVEEEEDKVELLVSCVETGKGKGREKSVGRDEERGVARTVDEGGWK